MNKYWGENTEDDKNILSPVIDQKSLKEQVLEKSKSLASALFDASQPNSTFDSL